MKKTTSLQINNTLLQFCVLSIRDRHISNKLLFYLRVRFREKEVKKRESMHKKRFLVVVVVVVVICVVQLAIYVVFII